MWRQQLPYYGAMALFMYMPFHVFLSQSLSEATGGLNEWKIGKDIFTGLLAIATIALVWRARKTNATYRWLVGLGLAYFLLHIVLWAAHPHIYRTSALLGVLYNNRVIAYAAIGLGVNLLWPQKISLRFWLRLSVALGTIVALLGVVQYFLPSDTLSHTGYSLARGVRPAFFIDNNPHFVRIMSTLRDPNSLGAYLLVPMTILFVAFLRERMRMRRLFIAGLFGLQAVALGLSFSRSAWLAIVVALVLAVWFEYRTWLVRQAKRFWPLLVAVVLLMGAGAYSQRHNPLVKHYIIHSTGKPQSAYDSDGFHLVYAERGLRGIAHNPLGHGPGTAGLASIQNPKGSFLTENYYIQIGYEVGVIGLAIFVAINILLYRALARRGSVGTVLLATFWAYALTNMLLHIWSNEAVAAQWWLLAGFAIGSPTEALKKDRE